MKKEFDVLQKKIHLHENEIERIQELSSKYADKKGNNEGELKRLKFRLSEQIQILKQSKSTSLKKEETTKLNHDYGYVTGGMTQSNSGQEFFSFKKLLKTAFMNNSISLFGDQKNLNVLNLKSTIRGGNISR